VTPGIANWYASSCTECEAGCGILVKTREARPIKFEGNPKHAASQGGLCARGQASVLNLYDPDRLQAPLAPGRKNLASGTSWEDLDSKVVDKIRAARGKTRILMGETSSPSAWKAVTDFTSQLGAGVPVVWEPQGLDELLNAQDAAYGTRVAPRLRFDRANYVLSFGADFLGNWLNPVAFGKDFSKRKKLGAIASKKAEPLRFVAIESMLTLTGSNADRRLRVNSGGEVRAALAIAHELIVNQSKTRYSSDSSVRALLEAHSVSTVSKDLGIDASALKKVANELWADRGKSIVVGAGHGLKGAAGNALEVVVALLNSALENEGNTVDGTTTPFERRTNFEALTKLIRDMKAGAVDVLVISGVNPAYGLPKNAGFEEALAKVGTVVYVGTKFDETARLSDYVAAASHALEAWGDAEAQRDLFSIQQPTIRPLYNTRSFEETLMAWAKKLGMSGALVTSPTWHEFVKSNWKNTIYSNFSISAPFALFWESLLREGVFDGVAAKGSRELGTSRARSFDTSSLRSVAEWTAKNGGVTSEMTLVLYPKIGMYDGRSANNGWLQELPDPISKITWDNYAALSVATAKKLGVVEGDVLRLKTSSGELHVPAHVQPGVHDQVVALAVGYGRIGSGRVSENVGVNAYILASANAETLDLSGIPVTIEKTSKREKLAATQMHHRLEGRPIVREADYPEYVSNPKAGNPDGHPLVTLWQEHKYPGYRWGMAIDLSSCTGCGACVIGCQSENNIPVVGKKFVETGREMHWIRIDRYYNGSDDNPETVHQPMLCQHCENAPCETVCPVLATMHDDEGLNQQVYNRCVGTRYCANNCPYKVRRFNWFTFTEVAKPLHLAYNPDLTVRTRGIMEKCTFCMQRIRDGKDRAKDLGTTVVDGQVQTACQQSCPSDAIVFGNVNDKNSRIAKINADPRGYHVLEELNVKPSVTYLTKIRNKNA